MDYLRIGFIQLSPTYPCNCKVGPEWMKMREGSWIALEVGQELAIASLGLDSQVANAIRKKGLAA